ncbi:MAG: aquaporin [Bacteroidia bacterium]|nr:aquaporin [Bacteroidia bacterium]
MLKAWQTNWRSYLIEGWALGMFMVSAVLVVILMDHPALPVRGLITDGWIRRMIIGIAMGLTAVLLIYSGWGKRSGAHMNPAVTLAFLQIERISPYDALGYILGQCIGSAGSMLLMKTLLFSYISAPEVNYVVTVPGSTGVWTALGLEAAMAAGMFLMVLIMSNHKRLAPYTGYAAGVLVAVYITVEAPLTGMSINPARTIASALSSGIWTDWWIYCIGPVTGMQAAAFIYRHWYRYTHGGNCLTMDCHMSGEKHHNETYTVLGPTQRLTPS